LIGPSPTSALYYWRYKSNSTGALYRKYWMKKSQNTPVLVQENSFAAAFLHGMPLWEWQKTQQSLKPAVDYLDGLIGPAGLRFSTLNQPFCTPISSPSFNFTGDVGKK
jgi:hypothetical protein